MTNYDIADHFSLLSKLMDIHGENSFKTKSYSVAAFNIEKLPVELVTLDDAGIFAQKGIGETIGKKIRELLNDGKMSLLQQYLESTPAGIVSMLDIKGLGPKKISVIWKELSVESIGELEYACNENRLVTLKGFGAKTQENILKTIAFIRANEGFHLWAEIEEIAKGILQQLIQKFPEYQFSLTGDFRRQMPVISNIDFLTSSNENIIREFFSSVNEASFENAQKCLIVSIQGQPKLRFHFTSEEIYFNDLFLTTGSPAFIESFIAKYPLPPNAASEEAIFSAHNLQFIPAPLRETERIIEKAASNAIPELITAGDIKGIIHSHSTWSDGMNSIEEMAKTAMKAGFEYLVLSDHSQAAFYANGLTPDRIAAQHAEIDALNEKIKPFKIFKSIEADILYDGSLDYSNDVLATFDLVIASVHSILKMTEEKAMERLIKAIENPYTTILGHPTGRLLLSREGYPVDHKKLIDACVANNVVMEINAHPRRLDLDWRWIDYAMERGALLSIDPDAHTVNGFRDVYYGAMAAQKGGLTATRNLSSFSLSEFEAFLAKRNA
ncbi:DNA polymerase/3'-5' exonuclease PolX [Taibaiella soli]|uniref:DNA polymerase/3'-5' exonuclease PolX n=1 Tax=Taibaiella soli TaxID=1649169 RepID=A0A2W2AIV0_9BACT|nr:DNA polymerase/3'-5' exonuclease PolX [Taibaiella soli]PZF73502.1 DNA polymerase/3'-5' exonuclease PolX [Taibaiella soli]